jgi:SAM-dependent methyltransferase
MNYRKVYDTTEQLAGWYDSHYKEMGDGWETPAAECNRHLDDLGVPFDKSKVLLDVGCGAGHFLVEVDKRVKAIGIDPSAQVIEWAERRCRQTTCVLWHRSVAQYFKQITGQFDYITSLGSLEHIPDLDEALDCIRQMLKPNGKFYFYCPNELWRHEDQPNELVGTDQEWMDLFGKHGLTTQHTKRWNDSTAFWGVRSDVVDSQHYRKAESGSEWLQTQAKGLLLNVGSGQRRLDGYINVDCISREGQVPDRIDDARSLATFSDDCAKEIVLCHVLEHFVLPDAAKVIASCHRVLEQGGLLKIVLPNPRALAQRWLAGLIPDYIYFVNMMGAWQGEEGDSHRWHWTEDTLREMFPPEMWIFDKIGGFANLPSDWWMSSYSVMKR